MTTLHQRTEEFKKALKKARRSKAVKTTLALVALGIGAYYGTKAPFQQIAGDVREMKTDAKELNREVHEMGLEVSMLGLDLMEYQETQDMFKDEQRTAITDLIKEGKPFTHYPGVGVLDHSVAGTPKK